MRVNLQMANNQIFEYPGVVRAIEADFNNETGNIAFRATFPNPKIAFVTVKPVTCFASAPLQKCIDHSQKTTFEILKRNMFSWSTKTM